MILAVALPIANGIQKPILIKLHLVNTLKMLS